MKKWFLLLTCAGLAGMLLNAAPSAELIEAAKKEGALSVYTTTSRVSGSAKKFEAMYGIKVTSASMKDGELVEKVSTELTGNVYGADLILAQDGARIYGELINPGYVVNYVPEDMKKLMPPEDQDPFVFAYYNTVFIFNNETTKEPVIKNVWELTEPQWKNRVQFKDPNVAGVNMNFLTMLLSPEWTDKLAAAYKERYGKDYAGEYENAAYGWIAGFFANAVLGNSDTTISENVGTKKQEKLLLGLFVLAKARYEESKDLALQPLPDTVPFAGFYFPTIALLTKNAKNPNAAKLFLDYLMTEEGFKPWSVDVGTYSGNPTVPANKDDLEFTYWRTRLVPENAAFTYENRAKMEEFINDIINK